MSEWISDPAEIELLQAYRQMTPLEKIRLVEFLTVGLKLRREVDQERDGGEG